MKETILRTYAKDLRGNPTEAELLLWKYLRKSQQDGVKFRRQEPMGPYIVDFVSYDKKLIVELDGGQHTDDEEYDRRRDDVLRSNGFRVLRFWDHEVFKNIEGVLERIREHFVASSPTP